MNWTLGHDQEPEQDTHTFSQVINTPPRQYVVKDSPFGI